VLSIEGRGRYEDLVGTSRYCRVGSLSDLGPEPAPEVMESALVVAGSNTLSSCASWASRTVWNDMSHRMDPFKQTESCGEGGACEGLSIFLPATNSGSKTREGICESANGKEYRVSRATT
jgi:hypothetical protein